MTSSNSPRTTDDCFDFQDIKLRTVSTKRGEYRMKSTVFANKTALALGIGSALCGLVFSGSFAHAFGSGRATARPELRTETRTNTAPRVEIATPSATLQNLARSLESAGLGKFSPAQVQPVFRDGTATGRTVGAQGNNSSVQIDLARTVKQLAAIHPTLGNAAGAVIAGSSVSPQAQIQTLEAISRSALDFTLLMGPGSPAATMQLATLMDIVRNPSKYTQSQRAAHLSAVQRAIAIARKEQTSSEDAYGKAVGPEMEQRVAACLL